MPYDEQFNETKTFGFVGDELRAGINQVCCRSVSQVSQPISSQSVSQFHHFAAAQC